MDHLVAIDALDDAVHAASPVPLTGQVRMRAGDLALHAGAVRGVLPPGMAGDPRAHALQDRLDTLERGAKRVPLTDQVRFDTDEVYAILDEPRALVAPG